MRSAEEYLLLPGHHGKIRVETDRDFQKSLTNTLGFIRPEKECANRGLISATGPAHTPTWTQVANLSTTAKIIQKGDIIANFQVESEHDYAEISTVNIDQHTSYRDFMESQQDYTGDETELESSTLVLNEDMTEEKLDAVLKDSPHLSGIDFNHAAKWHTPAEVLKLKQWCWKHQHTCTDGTLNMNDPVPHSTRCKIDTTVANPILRAYPSRLPPDDVKEIRKQVDAQLRTGIN